MSSIKYLKITPQLQKAINTASKLHIGQTRKSDLDLPCISHPFSAAWILSCYTVDIRAALKAQQFFSMCGEVGDRRKLNNQHSKTMTQSQRDPA